MLFGGLTCYTTYRQLQFTEEMLGFEADQYVLAKATPKEEPGGEGGSEPRPTRQQKKEQQEMERREVEAREVDRILQKIAETGMASLSKSERALLERATQEKRKAQQGGSGPGRRGDRG